MLRRELILLHSPSTDGYNARTLLSAVRRSPGRKSTYHLRANTPICCSSVIAGVQKSHFYVTATVLAYDLFRFVR
jgi:hypothetical protein